MQQSPRNPSNRNTKDTLRAYVASRSEPAAPSPVLKIAPATGSASQASLSALADVSRRIQDLARELKCLGHFDDDPDRPRAA